MHEQEIRSSIDGSLNRTQRNIDGCRDAPDRPTIIDLKAVQRHRVIRMTIDLEQAVDALREFNRSQCYRAGRHDVVTSSDTVSRSTLLRLSSVRSQSSGSYVEEKPQRKVENSPWRCGADT